MYLVLVDRKKEKQTRIGVGDFCFFFGWVDLEPVTTADSPLHLQHSLYNTSFSLSLSLSTAV